MGLSALSLKVIGHRWPGRLQRVCERRLSSELTLALSLDLCAKLSRSLSFLRNPLERLARPLTPKN